MQTEIEKRIEAELESIWNGERKELEYKFKNFDTGFKAGAKFILEMPELKGYTKYRNKHSQLTFRLLLRTRCLLG